MNHVLNTSHLAIIHKTLWDIPIPFNQFSYQNENEETVQHTPNSYYAQPNKKMPLSSDNNWCVLPISLDVPDVAIAELKSALEPMNLKANTDYTLAFNDDASVVVHIVSHAKVNEFKNIHNSWSKESEIIHE